MKIIFLYLKISEADPLIERNDDEDDDEEVNPFLPDSSSTRGPTGVRYSFDNDGQRKRERNIFHWGFSSFKGTHLKKKGIGNA